MLLYIAHDPAVRLRDIATTPGITERSAFGIVIDLTEAGYVVKDKDGRRNRYRDPRPTCRYPETDSREPAISEVLALLLGNTGGRDGPPDLATGERGHCEGADVITTRPGVGAGRGQP